MSMTLETIRAAHARIAPYIVRTPLLRLPALDDALGCEVYVKAVYAAHGRIQAARRNEQDPHPDGG